MCKRNVSPLIKSKGTRDKNIGEVGMASESTKTTQTSVQMAQHNRWHDYSARVGW